MNIEATFRENERRAIRYAMIVCDRFHGFSGLYGPNAAGDRQSIMVEILDRPVAAKACGFKNTREAILDVLGVPAGRFCAADEDSDARAIMACWWDSLMVES